MAVKSPVLTQVHGFGWESGNLALALEKITDRALLALAHDMTPGYLTRGGIPRAKTGKARAIDRAELDTLLQLMVNDLGIRTPEGYTETALRFRLLDLGVVRGVFTVNEKRTAYETARSHGPWTLWDVMSQDRRDREYPGRRDARYGPR